MERDGIVGSIILAWRTVRQRVRGGAAGASAQAAGGAEGGGGGVDLEGGREGEERRGPRREVRKKRWVGNRRDNKKERGVGLFGLLSPL